MRFRMKPGCGKHRITTDGRDITVRVGEIVNCSKEDIGAAMDKFEQLDPDVLPPPSRFKIVSSPGGFYDVIHPVNGIAINSKKLRKAEAEALAGMTVEEYDARIAKEAETARLVEEKAGNETGQGEGAD